MTFEELIYLRFSSYKDLSDKLTTYAGKPAAFYQKAPDDKQQSWGETQYPRVVYTIDMQADQERKSAGVMQVDLYCDESKNAPEDIEPYIRECLKNLIVKPDGNSCYAFAWAKTEMFDILSSGQARGASPRIIGATVRFDILEYSQQETTNPDPEAAVRRWLKDLEPLAFVLNEDDIDMFYEPSGERPAFYVRIASYKTNRITYAIAWLDCTFSIHVIAPEPEIRNSWVRWLADQLNIAGEIIMLDDSIMLIHEISVDTSADYLSKGQINVKAEYSISRLGAEPHPLSQTTTKEK